MIVDEDVEDEMTREAGKEEDEDKGEKGIELSKYKEATHRLPTSLSALRPEGGVFPTDRVFSLTELALSRRLRGGVVILPRSYLDSKLSRQICKG